MNDRLSQRMLDTPVGSLRLVASEHAVVGLYFPAHDPAPKIEPSAAAQAHPILDEAASQLHGYFAGKRERFELPLDLRGTAFQREVWAALTTIEFGRTCSYGALASTIGKPKAVRAVGTANGRNPISIIVPCHRVIGSQGKLVGYAGGLERKRWLLAHEGITLL